MVSNSKKCILHYASLFIVILLTGIILTLNHIPEAQASNLAGRKVTLDPGHGWSNSFTGASANGMVEKDLTLDIANQTKAVLESYGIQVFMTRTGDEPTLPLSTAATRVNQQQSEVAVSIHVNASGGTGTESCYTIGKSTSSESLRLGTLLTEKVSTLLGLNNRGNFPENDPGRCGLGRPQLYIHDMNPPAAIIETAFIDGPLNNDVAKLMNQRADFAQAIAQAIVEYLGGGNTVRSGFDSNVLAANDDGSTGLVSIGFPVNFFGNTYNFLYVNNNGNITFDAPMFTYTPFPLLGTSRVIIAPFFGDVDTRAGNIVTYGAGTVGGRPAFGVTWPDVGCYSRITSVLNKFQVVLIDRSDIGPGDFDIEFNYDRIEWEAGQASGGNSACQGGFSARVGYSNGSTVSFELPGSGVIGAFLDSNTNTGLIHNSRNSFQNGRYLFEVRNGVAPTGGSISGRVFANSTANPLLGAFVQVCGGGGLCNTTQTNASGQYSVSGLADGQYNVTAFPPAGVNVEPGTIGPLTIVSGGSLSGQDIILTGPTPPPPGTTITSRGTGTNGVPIIYWREDLALITQGCPGATASYQIIQDGAVIRSGNMTEGLAGVYTAVIPQLYPLNGYARVVINILCPDSSTTTIPFDIYIDPSGVVETVDGVPIEGATVTLFRSDSSSGPFVLVPNGSGIMSPENRINPDFTDASGRFGWNVIAGFYKVRAEKEDCVSPTDPALDYVESLVLTIPPPVTDLVLQLDCPLVNLPPTAVAGGPYSVNEGSTIPLNGTISSDPDAGDTLEFEWDFEYDSVTFNVDATGPTPTFDATSLDGPSDSRTVALRVTDSNGASDIDTADVAINNVAPVVLSITAPVDPVAVGSPIVVTAVFTDPGILDTHTVFWTWGDGAADTIDPATSPTSANHTYSTGGIYTIAIAATDDDGDAGTDVYEFVVVYDTDGGFVTGGGWIDSPVGAYKPDTSLIGKANFGFVSKYKKGQSVPTGQTEFQFHVADLNFHSDNYDWLVVAGHKATFKGVGTINGVGNYGFMISAIDEKLTPSTDVDLFRIKIWDKDNSDAIVYENQMDAGDDIDPTTALGGGNIIIHK